MRCVIVADDLTGAADASAPLAGRGLTVCVSPWSEDDGRVLRGVLTGGWDVVVAETDSRDATAALAAARVAAVADAIAVTTAHAPTGQPWIVKKIDSLLRGPIAAEIGALMTGLRLVDVVVAPALPSLGRTTEDGVQHWDGRAVDLPRSDGGGSRLAADADVARACGVPDAQRVPAGLAPSSTGASVCDAMTDAHLAVVADALAMGDARPLVVGSSGLLDAFAPHLTAGGGSPARRPSTWGEPTDAGPLIISLSPTEPARRQVADLQRQRDAETIVLPIADAVADAAAAGAALAARITACMTARTSDPARPRRILVTIDHASVATGPADAVRAAILRSLRHALSALPARPSIVANGGDGARTVVEAWGLGALEVIGPLPHGAAAVRTSDGGRMAMKSGSFGPDHALTDLVDAIEGATATGRDGGTQP